MVSPSMMTSTGPSCSRMAPPQSSMADMAICEIAPSAGRSLSRTAMVSGTPESVIFSCISEFLPPLLKPFNSPLQKNG